MLDIEQLAKNMRERALLIEGDETLDEGSLRNFHEVAEAKAKKRQQLESLKKLYFNAGRWVGGARDQVARNAWLEMKAREK
jgi:anthranilate phosphoribosyltransferase